MDRVFLIGYMGSGKTTVGKLLAEKLGYSFIDMDAHIEEKYFKSVSEIFAKLGEQEFRKLEKNCLCEIAEFENVVISTGGGTPCFFNNMEYMNAHGLTIYLKLSAKELANRLEHSREGKRPLLADRKGEELIQFISEGLAWREPFYIQAGLSVNSEDENVVSQICDFLQKI
jgi:shikimate kinase